MKLEIYLASRLIKGVEGRHLFARPAVKIALLTIILGTAIMVLSLVIIAGFKKNIVEKLTGFAAHFRLSRYDLNVSLESVPIQSDSAFVSSVRKMPALRAVYPFAFKNGIIKTDEEVQGIVLKGIDSLFFSGSFHRYLIEGNFDRDTNRRGPFIVISKQLSTLLKKSKGDDLLVYFIQDPPRIRKMNITGIYDTGMEEFDRMYAFCSLSLIQRLNGWSPQEFTGYEIELQDMSDMEQAQQEIQRLAPPLWRLDSVQELFPQIFNWLKLINVNGVILITLITAVVIINMIIILLILILDQTFFTGVMKTLGATDGSIRTVFILMTGFLLLTGMAAGNLIALLLAFLQSHFGWIKLSPDSYYMEVVPVSFHPVLMVGLNVGVLLVAMLVMIIPSAIIRNISPVEVLRFD
jgi:lipoprotein-releasing system permease protein